MSGAQDARFDRLQTDPRFRRPKQKQLKVEIDERFKDVLQSEEFGGGSTGKGKGKQRVDKHGKPLRTSHHQDQLRRFYRLKSPSPGEAGPSNEFIDYARGEGNLESSGSEDGSDGEEDEESEIEEEELEVGGKVKRRPVFAEEFDQSDDEDEDDSEDEDHLNIDLSENEDAFPNLPDEGDDDDEDEDEGSTIDPTTRIAAVNLDWDNLRAGDLFIVFNSFLKEDPSKRAGKDGSSSGAAAGGRLLSVKIYPSEFGKERMAKEDMQGPAGGAFINKKGSKSKSRKGKGEIVIAGRESDDDEEDDEEEEEGFEGSDLEDMEEMSGSDLDDLGEEEGSDAYSDDEDEDGSLGDDDLLPDMSRPNGEDDNDDAMSVSSGGSARSEEIDADALRQYQLDRLRYYYAVATFSSVEAASKVMQECQGTEFERTANVMDLSYVPEGMEFEESDVKDVATKEPKGYKGNDFVTDALRHSKVKLTWDQDDPNRVKVTRRNMTAAEIEEQDFKDYIASSGSEDEDEEDDIDSDAAAAADGAHRPFANLPAGTADKANGEKKGKNAKDAGSKKSKKAEQKERAEKIRALLLSGEDPNAEIYGKAALSRGDQTDAAADGDLAITFTPALGGLGAGGISGVATNADDENLTTLEKYQLRMKEKKMRKKEKMEIKRGLKDDAPEQAASSSAVVDDFFAGDSESEEESAPAPVKSSKKAAKQQADATSKSANASNGKPAAAPAAPEPAAPADPAPPSHADLTGSSQTHFSMKDILKAEKEDGPGGKKRKRKSHAQRRKEAEAEAKGRTREVELGEEGWKIDVKDSRFKALHEDPQFAIDPSNPHFTKTKAMQDLLAARTESRAKQNRATGGVAPAEDGRKPLVAEPAPNKEKSLAALAEDVKRKMERSQKKQKMRK